MTTNAVFDTPDVNQIVAANLRAELSRQRWSGRKAAAALGLTPVYVNRRLNGDTALDPNDLAMFSRLLHVPIGKFFEETEKAPTARGGGEWLPELDSNQQPAG